MKNGTTQTASALSARDFAALGLSGVAYVKPKLVDGQRLYAIHTADGKEVAVLEGWEEALATVRSNDLEPVWLH